MMYIINKKGREEIDDIIIKYWSIMHQVDFIGERSNSNYTYALPINYANSTVNDTKTHVHWIHNFTAIWLYFSW
jgi:hypothetical protein